MPAVIFGERFRGRGVPAWHGIGDTFEDADAPETAEEAFIDCGLNYLIEKKELVAEIGGILVPVPNHFGLFRTGAPEGDKFLDVVGSEFEPVQNMELAEMLDASGLTKLYQVETLGALGDGETVFMALSDRDGEFDIAGSPAKNYWTLYDGKTGKKALGLMNTPVKVVCSNTLNLGIQAATINIKISHTVNAKAQLDFWMGIAPQLKSAEIRTREIINTLVQYEVNEEEAAAILEAAYPAPKTTGKASLKSLIGLELSGNQQEMVDRAITAQDKAALLQWQRMTLAREVFENYPNSDDEKKQAGTAWGVVEAIVDVEDHREASSTRENVSASAINGQRAKTKERAMAAAMALIS